MLPNLHAERRLADFARQSTGQDMDIDMLAGTMRPCGTCADAIEAPLETHRGPYWMSKASTAGRDVPADIQRSAAQRSAVGRQRTPARLSSTRQANGSTAEYGPSLHVVHVQLAELVRSQSSPHS